MKKQNIEQEVKRTFGTLDKLQRVEANPYLATRVLARWEREQEENQQPQGVWRWQWVLVAALLVINGFTLLPKWINLNAKTDYMIGIANDYNLYKSSEMVYDYIQPN